MAKEVTYHIINNRIPLSLRLPERVVTPIDEYAALNHINRTEAVLHFLELGLEAEQRQNEAASLDSLQSKVDEILDILKTR